MRHPPCVLCEGLDTCRFLDCQEAIPDGHTLCWHCEAALAEDFAPKGPDDVFYRTPEPWEGGGNAPGSRVSNNDVARRWDAEATASQVMPVTQAVGSSHVLGKGEQCCSLCHIARPLGSRYHGSSKSPPAALPYTRR